MKSLALPVIAICLVLLPVARRAGPDRAPAAVLFPNAPRTAEWRTYADYRWGARPGNGGSYEKIPFWHEPTYDRDNGSHVVDYGADAPNGEWPSQLSRLLAADDVPGGGNVLEIRFPKGFPGGYAPARIFRHPRYDGNGLSWSPSSNTGFLYIGLHFRFSPGFSPNGNVSQKLVYANSNASGNASLNHVPLNLRTSDGRRGLYPAYEPQQPFGLYQVPAEPENDVNDGRWHLVEVLQEPNTPGTKNGRIRIYIDGRLAGSWSKALLFDRGQTPSLNSLSLNTVFGGGSNPVPADQRLMLGPLRVMGR
ncbi:MAG: hypothetical protein H6Q77_324 [Gemmatimonadetes bacterium]|nr:hypothetical protein [Gemmatimonadota bacterium]